MAVARLPVRRNGYVERTGTTSDGVRLAARADMRTYRVDRLAADLADVLIALRARGPLTLTRTLDGPNDRAGLPGPPAADRPVEPQGLVLIATAAGRLAERGLGRLLGTRATGPLFDVVHHIPRRIDQALGGPVRPIYDGLLRYSGAARRGAAAATTSPVHTVSLTTAAGFLPSLRRHDQYDALASVVANTVVISGGADIATPAEHAWRRPLRVPRSCTGPPRATCCSTSARNASAMRSTG